MEGRICQIWRCSRRAELYLYLDKKDSPESLPEELRQQLGRLEPVMVLHITAARKLARVSAEQVLQGIAERGYYLQLPPTPLPGGPS